MGERLKVSDISYLHNTIGNIYNIMEMGKKSTASISCHVKWNSILRWSFRHYEHESIPKWFNLEFNCKWVSLL